MRETVPRPLADVVRAAQLGDRSAVDELVAGEIGRVYNVVGRALNGHADVDDVVQETLIQVVRGLPGLRDPERFRGWVLAIAYRQIRLHQRRQRRRTWRQRELATEIPDPGSDFATRTVTELLLEGQRRDLAEAARWLDADDRSLLSLWWQEAAGEISRTELADALGVTPGHAGVRVKRLKDRLDSARMVTRALTAGDCPQLARAVHGWSGRPDTLWRKRLNRHVRDCPHCGVHRRGLLPPEKLLLGILPVPVPGALIGTALTAAPVWSALGVKAAAIAASVAAVVGAGFAYRTFNQPPPPTVAAPATPSISPSPSPAVSAPPATINGVATADFFVAPDGSDDADGTLASPFATIGRAAAVVRPGQTIAMRGGTYRPAGRTVIRTDGRADRRITLRNWLDERPVIDFGGGPGIEQSADHWTVQGLEIRNAGGTAYTCESCSGNVFRRLRLHGNVQSGLMLSGDGTIGNQVLDCDFYDNHDPSRPEQAGVGLNIRFGDGSGNVVRGNRAFDNGDNGFDLGGFRSPVTLEQNWAWGNGIDHWNMPGWRSAASGFALGGGDPAPSAAHVVRQNRAWGNAAHGFSDDENPAVLRLSGNTAWRNSDAGFSMRVAAADLSRNVAVGNGIPVFRTGAARSTGNSWDDGAPAVRFRSTDPSTAEGPRAADGRLPSTGFLVRAP